MTRHPHQNWQDVFPWARPNFPQNREPKKCRTQSSSHILCYSPIKKGWSAAPTQSHTRNSRFPICQSHPQQNKKAFLRPPNWIQTTLSACLSSNKLHIIKITRSVPRHPNPWRSKKERFHQCPSKIPKLSLTVKGNGALFLLQAHFRLD
jgi:hypothetical protein